MKDDREFEAGQCIEITPAAGDKVKIAGRGMRLIAQPIEGDGERCESMCVSSDRGQTLMWITSSPGELRIELAPPGDTPVSELPPGLN